jgi:hypothetical protein
LADGMAPKSKRLLEISKCDISRPDPISLYPSRGY